MSNGIRPFCRYEQRKLGSIGTFFEERVMFVSGKMVLMSIFDEKCELNVQ